YETIDEALAQIGRICRMVEGTPLAIELAAAWMDVLSPGEIADELDKSIAFLRSDLRDLPERHHSMVAAFDVSWGMLGETEREAFAALSVFRGGCTREAAEAVAGAGLSILRALVRKSFLTRDERGRYQVHELLRQYGEDKLRERPEEWERVLDRHCAYYARWMDQQRFPADGEAATVLPEIDNIRTGWSRAVRALRFAELRQYRGVAWLYELSGRSAEAAAVFGWADEGLRAAYAQGLDRDETIAVAVALQVVSLAVRRIDKQKSISLLQEAVALLRSVDAREELALINGTIVKAGLVGYGAEARQLLEENISVFREMGNDVQVADELNNLAEFALRVGDSRSAEGYCREALQIGEAVGNRRVIGWSLETAGKAAYVGGQYDVAVQYVERALALWRQLGYEREIAMDCSLLGEAYYAARALADAAVCHREAVSLWLDRGSPWRRMASGEYHGVVYSLCRLGDICLAQGDAAEAEQRYGEGLHAAVDGEPAAVLYAVVRQGELLAREGQLAPAAELATLVAEHPESIPEARERALALLADMGERLSPQELVAVQEHGEAMSLDEAVAELLREPGK
ncbi:MAG: tetratricopeptide repeat protein, partial [Anaerolineae bacterium]